MIFGMLAMFIVLAYRALGLYGLLAFFVPPVMLRYVMKQYTDGTEKNASELRRVNRDLVQANEDVVNTLQELRSTYGATLKALSTALDSRGSETEGHSHRVVAYTEAMGRQLGLPDREIANLLNGALLHDVGEIGVPDAVLRKPGRLTEDEWAIMKTHPDMGYRMLEHIGFLKDALPTVRHHHERYDGGGYPSRLSGEQVPLSAHIFAVADAFDAMTSDRPYRRACSIEEARREIASCAGSQFDPKVVDAFLELSATELTRLSGLRVQSEDIHPAVKAAPAADMP